ncbi:MAG: 16S rRNA (cytosine(1402)-N(4))-methyltransferase RsmH, partial [Alphaproteobacteria bacterium]
MAEGRHVPALVTEVVRALGPAPGRVYVDATFGGGGYSRALLESAPCRVWAIDRDPAALARGRSLAAAFPGRLTMIEGRFGAMDRLLAAAGVTTIHGVAFDLGVSSFQLDDPARGFSFQTDGPLDLRMGADGPTAADVVNRTAEDDLADILHRYGEERRARAVARAIVRARTAAAITRTGELADIVRRVVRRSADGIDPATRTFQALRIYVNHELEGLDAALRSLAECLAPGGRLAVIAFHSLED